MIVVNFSHPLTAAQVAQAEALTRQTIERVVELGAADSGRDRDRDT